MLSRPLMYLMASLFLGIIGWLGMGISASAVTSPMPSGLFADSCTGSKCIACNELQQLNNSSQECNKANSSVSSVIYNGVNVLSFVVGVIAIIMIILSGFRFIVSGGDSNGVSNAKRNLIYALVGLAVAASADALVRFMVHTSFTGVIGYFNLW